MASSILIPFEFPDPEPVSPVLVEDLSSLEIVLLGHYGVPEQTPKESARDEFEDEVIERLEELAEPFIEAGADVRTRLVFGKDRAAAIDRVTIEEECAAELDPAPTEGIDRILVPLPDVAEFDRLPRFVDVLCEDTANTITLFHVVEGEEDHERGEEIVTETREGLLEVGFDPDAVDTRVSDTGSHDDEIIRVASEYDAVVMYEAESRLGDRIFGTLPDRIRNATGDPVIVVRRDY
ncbi:MAG: nucleotide-binding universal stress UspA family protein [Natronomonas sp.]|jgi:nucleotide-binding universal stress UspA family protein|uniref:universal stress protein n=1 Tax=Natronomonas sp. TaxID=2184060 RepID=UPI003989E987